MKIAPKLKEYGPRRPRTSGLHPKANERVEKDAARFDCSKSYVIANIVAYHYGIKHEGNYRVK